MKLSVITPDNSRRVFVRSSTLPRLAALAVLLLFCATAHTGYAKEAGEQERLLQQLMGAAADGSDPNMLTALIKAGADVNARDNEGRTPLMRAANRNPNPEVITALVKAGADVNAKDNNGMTPLMWTRGERASEVIPILKEAGADINAKDKKGWTPLMWAAGGEFFADSQAITALLKSGADVNARDNEGRTPLMRTAESYDPEAVTLFIKAGADINAKDKRKWTPLMYAAIERDYPTIVTSLEQETIIALLRLGADPKPKDVFGKRAIDYARKNWRLKSEINYARKHGRLKGVDALKQLEEASR